MPSICPASDVDDPDSVYVDADTDDAVAVAVSIDHAIPVTVLFGVLGAPASTASVLRLQAQASTIETYSSKQDLDKIGERVRCHGCFFEHLHAAAVHEGRVDAPTSLDARHGFCRATLHLPPCHSRAFVHGPDSSGRDCTARLRVWRKLHGAEAAAAVSEAFGIETAA